MGLKEWENESEGETLSEREREQSKKKLLWTASFFIHKFFNESTNGIGWMRSWEMNELRKMGTI